MTTRISKRQFVKGSAVIGATLAMPAIARGQGKTIIRWGDLMPATHPQAQMIERIAKEVAAKTSGRIEIQSFPAGQLGSGKDMIEAVSAGNLTMTTDGAAALGQFLPQISLIEAPYLWRDAAHMAKVARLRRARRDEHEPRRQARHAHAGADLLRQASSDDQAQGGEDR